ncbi:hypothetical protein LRE75_34185 [Streptomyces sp. 372A]
MTSAIPQDQPPQSRTQGDLWAPAVLLDDLAPFMRVAVQNGALYSETGGTA